MISIINHAKAKPRELMIERSKDVDKHNNKGESHTVTLIKRASKYNVGVHTQNLAKGLGNFLLICF